MRSKHQLMIEKFMQRAGQEVPVRPTVPDEETRVLRVKIVLEEVLELAEALGVKIWYQGGRVDSSNCLYLNAMDEDVCLYGVADAVADISVTAIGTASACGINIAPVLKIVDENNLTKVVGDVRKREDGKLLKPPGYKGPGPRIRKELLKQGAGE